VVAPRGARLDQLDPMYPLLQRMPSKDQGTVRQCRNRNVGQFDRSVKILGTMIVQLYLKRKHWKLYLVQISFWKKEGQK